MENRRNRIYLNIIALIICFISVLGSFAIKPNYVAGAKETTENLKVHFIDVGQGDSTFIELPDGRTMLIDAGESTKGQTVVDYIKALGYTQIDLLVLTHSDSDHAGGMPKIFENFEIKTVYRPFVLAVNTTILPEGEDLEGKYTSSEIYTVTTATYARFIKCAYEEVYDGGTSTEVWVSYDGVTITSTTASAYAIEFHTPPKSSDALISSTGAITKGYPTKLYTGSEAEIKNSVSPIISLEVSGGKRFIFTGDATTKTEVDFLANLDAGDRTVVSNVDVLKVGHHGSDTSSSQEFLDLICPNYAVIMCGLNNKYNHPYDVILQRISDVWKNAEVSGQLLRTDKNGNIVFTQSIDNGTPSSTLSLAVAVAVDNTISTTEGDDENRIPQYVYYIAIGVVVFIIVIALVITANKNKNKRLRKKDVTTAKRTYKKAEKGISSTIDKLNRRK